jgi:hypothetical protein
MKTTLSTLRQHKIGVAFLIFWYVALFPGRIGYDGSLANSLMRAGKSTDIWTGQYFLITKILTLSGSNIWLASLFQLAILAFTLKIFCDAFIENEKRSIKVWTFLCATPLIGVFGVTIAHDVYLCAGILLVVADLRRHDQRTFYESRVRLIAVLLIVFLLSMNFLGYPVLFFYIVLNLLQRRIKIVAIISIFFLAFMSLSSVLVQHEITPPRYLFPLAADLKCIAQQPAAKLDAQDWIFLQKLADKEYLITPIACNSTDPTAILLDPVLTKKIGQQDFINGYLRIAIKNPATVLTSHVIKAEQILPPPFFPHVNPAISFASNQPVGMKTDSSLINGSDFLHISIDDTTIEKFSFTKPLELVALLATYLFNISSNLWGWGGFWLLLFLFYLSRKETSRGRALLISTPFLLLLISLSFAGPIAAPRYVFSVILAGLALTYERLTLIKM